MTEEEFYAKVKEKYGSRGVRQAKEVMSCTMIDGAGKSNDLYIQAVMKAFFISKERARQKFTPKRYRKSESACAQN